MPPLFLTYFEIKKYYQNEPKFNGVFSRNNLPKIKDEAYVINLDEYESVENHLFANNEQWHLHHVTLVKRPPARHALGC